MQNILKTIPDEPKIPLENYLMDLVMETDGKESSLYLRGVEKFIQEIWHDIVQNNWRTIKVRQFIPENFGVHHVMLYAYKNGKKSIPIQAMDKLLLLWKRYGGKSSKEIQEKWDEIFNSEFNLSVSAYYTGTKLPKYLSPKLSYLTGWICGDGHMRTDSNHYIVKISEKSESQLQYILQPLFQQLFGVTPPIFRIYKGGYAIQIGSKPIFRFLTKILKIKVGEIPRWISKLDEINKKYFLVGLFDSEGYVSKSRPRLTISQADSTFLRKVIRLFSEFGIEIKGPTTHRSKLGIWYTIRIDGKKEFLKFVDLIGSCHFDKSIRLKEMADKINAYRNCSHTT